MNDTITDDDGKSTREVLDDHDLGYHDYADALDDHSRCPGCWPSLGEYR